MDYLLCLNELPSPLDKLRNQHDVFVDACLHEVVLETYLHTFTPIETRAIADVVKMTSLRFGCVECSGPVINWYNENKGLLIDSMEAVFTGVENKSSLSLRYSLDASTYVFSDEDVTHSSKDKIG